MRRNVALESFCRETVGTGYRVILPFYPKKVVGDYLVIRFAREESGLLHDVNNHINRRK